MRIVALLSAIIVGLVLGENLVDSYYVQPGQDSSSLSISDMRQLVDNEIEAAERINAGQLSQDRLGFFGVLPVQPLLALRDIIKVDHVDVCHPAYVKQLIAFHEVYMKREIIKNSFVADFFTSFARQVAFVCKMGLVYNIEQEAYPNIEADKYKTLVPWLNQGLDKLHLIVPNITINDLITETTRDTNIVRNNENSNINIGTDNNNLKIIASKNSKSIDEPDISQYLTFKSSDDLRRQLEDAKATCPRFKQFYEGAIISLVHLSSLGYAPHVPDSIVEQQQINARVRLWLIIVKLCDKFDRVDIANVDLDTPQAIKQLYAINDHSPIKSTIGTEGENTEVGLRPINYQRNVDMIGDRLNDHLSDSDLLCDYADRLMDKDNGIEAMKYYKLAQEYDPSSERIKKGIEEAKKHEKPRSIPRKERNYYQILRVEMGASAQQIKSAHRQLVAKLHPDRIQGEEAKKEANEQLINLNEAREFLLDASQNGN